MTDDEIVEVSVRWDNILEDVQPSPHHSHQGSLMRLLLQQYHIKQLHQDAMVLDPRLKTKLLTAEEKEETLMALRSMMTEVPSHNDDTTEEASARPAKKLKQFTDDNIFW